VPIARRRPFLRSAARTLTARCRQRMVCGWAGALAGADGINIVAGTGSIAYGRLTRAAAHERRWGSSSDEGSAYCSHREGLTLTLSMCVLAVQRRSADGQGRGPTLTPTVTHVSPPMCTDPRLGLPFSLRSRRVETIWILCVLSISPARGEPAQSCSPRTRCRRGCILARHAWHRAPAPAQDMIQRVATRLCTGRPEACGMVDAVRRHHSWLIPNLAVKTAQCLPRTSPGWPPRARAFAAVVRCAAGLFELRDLPRARYR